jgi:tetrathionate reductase subunit B
MGELKMKSYAMVIDVARCNGCYSCVLSCKDEHCGEPFPGYSEAQPMTGQFWLKLIEQERGTYPKVKLSYTAVTCMQCKNAPCLEAAQNGAVYQRDDGIVMIDPEKAVGQERIVSACPYRVIFWNAEKKLAQKCTMCAHLLDQGWKRPRCAEMCPTGAITFGDAGDPESEISKIIASAKPKSLHPEYHLAERVLYLNVPKTFIAGTVVHKDTDQCAKEIRVTLKGGGVSASCVTDGFGDFWFENLNSKTEYHLEVEQAGFKKISRKISTLTDVNLGELFLEKMN